MDKEKVTQFLKEVRDYCKSQGNCETCLFLGGSDECIFTTGENPEKWKFVDECEKIIL